MYIGNPINKLMGINDPITIDTYYLTPIRFQKKADTTYLLNSKIVKRFHSLLKSYQNKEIFADV